MDPVSGFQLRPTLCCVACVPVPVHCSFPGEFDALLRNDTLPLAAPELCGANVTVNEALCPAGMDTGNDMPVTENPVPFQLALETVTLFEVAFNVPVRFLLLPTFTLPKLRVAGFTVSCPAEEEVPVPDNGMETFGLVASLTTARLPAPAPTAGGAKRTVTVALCPAARLKGKVVPLVLKPVPEAVTWVIWIDPWLAEFLRVTDDVAVLPTSTLPKATEVGLAVSCATLTPDPESGTVRFGSEALLSIATLPAALPDAVGVKLTFSVTCCPADKVIGMVAPLALNPAPETASCET